MADESLGVVVRAPGEGRGSSGAERRIKVDAAATGGAYALMEISLPPGSQGPLPHVHFRTDEAFYILEGESIVRHDGQSVRLSAGSYALIPRGVVHAHSNPGASPNRVLVIFSPAGMEEYFVQREAIGGSSPAAVRAAFEGPQADPLLREKFNALSSKYDMERRPLVDETTHKAPGLVVRAPGEGRGPSVYQRRIKADAAATRGAYGLMEMLAPPGSKGPLPHLHHRTEEAFHVLEGEAVIHWGDQMVQASAGTFVLIPRGVVHTISNPGTRPMRNLVIFSPAGMEEFFVEREALGGTSPDVIRAAFEGPTADPVLQARLAALSSRYDEEQRPLGG